MGFYEKTLKKGEAAAPTCPNDDMYGTWLCPVSWSWWGLNEAPSAPCRLTSKCPSGYRPIPAPSSSLAIATQPQRALPTPRPPPPRALPARPPCPHAPVLSPRPARAPGFAHPIALTSGAICPDRASLCLSRLWSHCYVLCAGRAPAMALPVLSCGASCLEPVS